MTRRIKTRLDRGRSGAPRPRKENDRHRRERQAFNKERRRIIRYALKRTRDELPEETS